MPSEREITVPPKRVAVIAVHGVGYTPPGATAKHLSDLLLGLGRLKLDEKTNWPDPDPPYQVFEKVPIVVGLKRPYLSTQDRVTAGFRVANQVGRRLLHVFDERLGYLAQAFSKEIPGEEVEKQVRGDTGKIAQEFMRVQLAGYISQTEGQAYDTVCLEGLRKEPEKPDATVHIYESYWADLSHPKNNILSFFLAFYQLVFHLSSLSRTAVYYAALEHMTDWRWRVVSFLQAFASRVLVLPIPILNLILLLTGLSVLPLKILTDHKPLAASVIASVFALAAYVLPRPMWSVPRGRWQWCVLLLIVAVLGGAIAYGLAGGNPRTNTAGAERVGAQNSVTQKSETQNAATGNELIEAARKEKRAEAVLAIEWWIFGGALLFQLLKLYNKVRRRALATGLTLLVISFIAFCFCLHQATDVNAPVEQASLWTIQLVVGALILCWVGLLGSALLLWLFNGLCLYWPKKEQGTADEKRAQRGRAKAALRTGRLTLAVSASTFLLVTIFIWSGIFRFGTEGRLNLYSSVQPTPPPIGETGQKLFSYVVPEPCLASCWIRGLGSPPFPSDKTRLLPDFVWALLLLSVTSGLPVMLALSVPALGILLWMLLPSLMLPRDRLNKFGNKITNSLGNWYSHGLDSTTVVATLLWHSIFTTAAVFGLLDYMYCHGYGSWLPGWIHCSIIWCSSHTLQMLYVAAGGLAVSGAAIAALALKYGKVPLDIVLDVDNYLRTSPLDNTPRARLVERYVSLLRYIAARSDENNEPYYSSIVIAAHSLGALISADLLHFLGREGDPELGRLGLAPDKLSEKPDIEISLLTFGNPIRQLLNRFFPHIYWWINASPDNSIAPLKNGAAKAKDVSAATTPTLDEVKLRSWVNAYRSGDYVGRSVWLDNWYRRNDADVGTFPHPAHEFSPVPNGSELCIGAGAHNDYWDRAAPEIAQQLDLLITNSLVPVE